MTFTDKTAMKFFIDKILYQARKDNITITFYDAAYITMAKWYNIL